MTTGCVWSFTERDIRLGTDGWQIDPPLPATGVLIERLFSNPIRTSGHLGENQ
jgi:hypothetical protein